MLVLSVSVSLFFMLKDLKLWWPPVKFYSTDSIARSHLPVSMSRLEVIFSPTVLNLREMGIDLFSSSNAIFIIPTYLSNMFLGCANILQKVAASCVWLASKLEESPRKSRQVIIVFHRMECRRENLPLEFLDLNSKVRNMVSRLHKDASVSFSSLWLIAGFSPSGVRHLDFSLRVNRSLQSWRLSWAKQRGIYWRKWVLFVMLSIPTNSFRTT